MDTKILIQSFTEFAKQKNVFNSSNIKEACVDADLIIIMFEANKTIESNTLILKHICLKIY